MSETLEVELPERLDSPLINPAHGLSSAVHTIAQGEDMFPRLQRDSTVMSFAHESEQKVYGEKLKTLASERSKILTRLRIFPWFLKRAKERLATIEEEINIYEFVLADFRRSDPVRRLMAAKQIMEKCNDLIAQIEGKLQ